MGCIERQPTQPDVGKVLHGTHAVIASALLFASASVQAESRATGCCGPCDCKVCVGGLEENATRSSEVFFGTVVAAEVLNCCDVDPRADVTFKVIRRWKGAETPRVVIRTGACTGIYPFTLGRNYLVLAEGTPPILSACFPPIEGEAGERAIANLDKPNPAADASIPGCYEIAIARPTTDWTLVPHRLALTLDKQWVRYEPVHTFYRANSRERGAGDGVWRTIDESRFRVDFSDGSVGWVLEVELTADGLKGVAIPSRDSFTLRDQSAPAALVKTECQ